MLYTGCHCGLTVPAGLEGVVRGAGWNPVRLGGDKRSVSSRTSDSLVVPLEPERPEQTVTSWSAWTSPHRALQGPGRWPGAAALTDGQGHGPRRWAARPRPTLSGQKAGWRAGFPGRVTGAVPEGRVHRRGIRAWGSRLCSHRAEFSVILSLNLCFVSEVQG